MCTSEKDGKDVKGQGEDGGAGGLILFALFAYNIFMSLSFFLNLKTIPFDKKIILEFRLRS